MEKGKKTSEVLFPFPVYLLIFSPFSDLDFLMSLGGAVDAVEHALYGHCVAYRRDRSGAGVEAEDEVTDLFGKVIDRDDFRLDGGEISVRVLAIDGQRIKGAPGFGAVQHGRGRLGAVDRPGDLGYHGLASLKAEEHRR